MDLQNLLFYDNNIYFCFLNEKLFLKFVFIAEKLGNVVKKKKKKFLKIHLWLYNLKAWLLKKCWDLSFLLILHEKEIVVWVLNLSQRLYFWKNFIKLFNTKKSAFFSSFFWIYESRNYVTSNAHHGNDVAQDEITSDLKKKIQEKRRQGEWSKHARLRLTASSSVSVSTF